MRLCFDIFYYLCKAYCTFVTTDVFLQDKLKS